jgi:hypothetical protein
LLEELNFLVLLELANARAKRLVATNFGEQFFVNKQFRQFIVERVGFRLADLFAGVAEHVEESLENTREFDHIKLWQLHHIVLELLRVARVVLGISNRGVLVRAMSAAHLSIGASFVTFKLLAVGDHALGVVETTGENFKAGFLEAKYSRLLSLHFALFRLVAGFGFQFHLSDIKLFMSFFVAPIFLNLIDLLFNITLEVFLLSLLPLVTVLLDSAKGVQALFFGQLTVLTKSVNANNELDLAVFVFLDFDCRPFLDLGGVGLSISLGLLFKFFDIGFKIGNFLLLVLSFFVD